ncbi:MAG: hypothetical protein KGL39_57095 [Patescibacteria group bacterium]|nr:hypothetical protein [Patescibacteria group bacterium]
MSTDTRTPIQRLLQFCDGEQGPYEYITADIRQVCAELAAATERAQKAEAENSCLHTVVAKANIPCVYCGLDNMALCKSGFPGCAKADDIICGEDEHMRGLVARLDATEAARKQAVEALEEVRRVAKEVAEDTEPDFPLAVETMDTIARDALAAQPGAAPNADGMPTDAPAARPPA